jgi:hypothetical protein
MSKGVFLDVQKEFGLHPSTLPAFHGVEGSFSKFFTYSDGNCSTLASATIVLKATQLYDIANYGISLNYDATSGITSAFIFGEGGTSDPQNRPRKLGCQSTQIREVLETTAQYWSMPLLLPIIILNNHFDRAQAFATDVLEPRVSQVEDDLGVSREGRRTGDTLLLDHYMATRQLSVDIEKLTQDMNTDLAEILGIIRDSEWEVSIAEALKTASMELEKKLSAIPDYRRLSSELQDSIEATDFAVNRLMEYNVKMKERVEAQLTVVSTCHILIKTLQCSL